MGLKSIFKKEDLRKEDEKMKFDFKKSMQNAKHKLANWIDNLGTVNCKVLVRVDDSYTIKTVKTELSKEEFEKQLSCNTILVMYGKKFVLDTTDLAILSAIELLEDEIEIIEEEE